MLPRRLTICTRTIQTVRTPTTSLIWQILTPKLFGISICLMNGEIIQLGDSQYRFGIESVSKVLTAILVLRQYGASKVLEMIGADATGLPFNSIMLSCWKTTILPPHW